MSPLGFSGAQGGRAVKSHQDSAIGKTGGEFCWCVCDVNVRAPENQLSIRTAVVAVNLESARGRIGGTQIEGIEGKAAKERRRHGAMIPL